MENERYARLMSVCIKTIGGLIRYRLINPSFLDTSKSLGGRVKQLLSSIMERSQDEQRRQTIYELCDQVIDVLDRKSVSDTILQWPGEDDEDE